MSRSITTMLSALSSQLSAFLLPFSFCLLPFALPLVLAGCADTSLEFREVKRIREKVTDAEMNTFLQIINSLPDRKLPKFPSVFAPPPDWDQENTYGVSELVEREIKMLAERSDVEKLAIHLQRNRRLQRTLRRKQMTPEQFVGLSLAIGVAISRSTLRDNQDLDTIIEEGERKIDELKQNVKPFHLHTQEGKHRVLQQAVWITRVDRAKRLKSVPPENYIELVQRYRKDLAGIFPEEFTANPLDAVADLLEEQGTPFEELPESGTDAEIEWNEDEAIVGREPPDPEFVH